MNKDVFGKALLDFQSGSYMGDIHTYSSLEEEDKIPLPHLFRNYENMPEIEQLALENCQGRVLDIGCGAGSHSLYLQQAGLDVTALDISQGATKVCQKRGVRQVVQADIMGYSAKKFDTLLLLMNGIGIVGSLEGLDDFLQHATKLLNTGGFILLDSSDIIYMFESENGNHVFPNTGNYYGEVEFQIRYNEQKSNFFDWLYVDFDTLRSSAERNGYSCEMLFKGSHYDYLAKLNPKL